MEQLIKELEQKLKAAAENCKSELSKVRTNRPTAKLVEDIKVEYLGQTQSVKQLGSISIAPPREIDINVWDKNSAGLVAKAIEKVQLGVTVNIDGSLLRINLPALSQERREELIKLVKSMIEQNKIKIRGLRDEGNKKLEQLFKEKKIGEDQKFKSKKQIQDTVDKINKEVDNLLLAKIKEINE